MERKYEFWLDSLAKKIIDREGKLKRGMKIFRCESGLGASGFPHIGSFGDVARNFAASIALKDQGVKSELIAYSDDLDGLRKVPLSMPDWLEKYIGMSVSNIPDPIGKCHSSFGEHIRSLLLDALDRAGIEYVHHSAAEDYKKGIFNEKIETLLLNSEKIGRIVREISGQEKFIGALPYFPVCEKCGKIYTTRSYEVLPKEHKVLYACDQEFLGKNVNNGKEIVVKGCGHKGEASYFNGNGKVSWKAEFAMRWSVLQIVFEAHGKDILDSVKINDEISRQVLNFEPPVHVVYEMFLDKSGKKIAKSFGNVFTPQVWFDYGSPKSLILLMLKRFEGTRELDITDVPKYMDELGRLEKIYFGLEMIKDIRELTNSKRLFEYVNFLKPPARPSPNAAYNTMLGIAKILPEENETEFALRKLKEFGIIETETEEMMSELKERLEFAKNWVRDFSKQEEERISLSEREKNAIGELIEAINAEEDGEEMQTRIFEIAKSNGMKPMEFFRIIYRIILKTERGPRLGPYILEIGKDEIIRKLKESLY